MQHDAERHMACSASLECDGLVSPDYASFSPSATNNRYLLDNAFLSCHRSALVFRAEIERPAARGESGFLIGSTRQIWPDPHSLSAARRAAADRAVSGLAWGADGEAGPRQEEDHRAAERAEAGHHPPRRHPRPRPERQTQTLRHPLARRRARGMGGETAQAPEPRTLQGLCG